MDTGALTTVPASAFPSGLTATYYNNTTMTGTPAATGTVSAADLAWNGQAPAAGVNASGWSATFTGTIDVPTAAQQAMTITGGTGADTITFNAVITSGTVDLGAGNDKVSLADGANTITLSNVETVVGGTGAINAMAFLRFL